MAGGLLLAGTGSVILSRAGYADALSDGRFRSEVADVLRAIEPTATVLPDPDPGQIRVGRLTIALTNLYPRVARLSGTERRQAIESYLTAFLRPAPGAPSGHTQTFDTAKSRLRVQLVPHEVLRQTPSLVHRAFSETLIVTYVLDEPNRYQYVTRDMLAGWGVDAASLEAPALANLDAASKKANFQLAIADDIPVLVMVATVDNYDAARLMLPGYLAQIAEALKTDSLTLAIPTRDLMLAWPADSKARRDMAEEVRKQMRTGAYARTDELFRFEKGAVRPLTVAERADHGR
ncbi:DUF1444 family protein [Methylobacterium haplocladii]|uniref:DUF1444 family protein n=1 Tax=Methylobacterium haplocladii TaxID=1176176 RepID=UPI0014786AB0|nr:DUF1444 family protein [Methylobacterium haplocladii]